MVVVEILGEVGRFRACVYFGLSAKGSNLGLVTCDTFRRRSIKTLRKLVLR